MQATFHKVAEAEVEAASKGASADEIADMTGQPENPRLVNLLKGGALSVTIKKGSPKQKSGVAVPSQPDLANQVCHSCKEHELECVRAWQALPNLLRFHHDSTSR